MGTCLVFYFRCAAEEKHCQLRHFALHFSYCFLLLLQGESYSPLKSKSWNTFCYWPQCLAVILITASFIISQTSCKNVLVFPPMAWSQTTWPNRRGKAAQRWVSLMSPNLRAWSLYSLPPRTLLPLHFDFSVSLTCFRFLPALYVCLDNCHRKNWNERCTELQKCQ